MSKHAFQSLGGIPRRLWRFEQDFARDKGPTYSDDAAYWQESSQKWAEQRKYHPGHFPRRSNARLI